MWISRTLFNFKRLFSLMDETGSRYLFIEVHLHTDLKYPLGEVAVILLSDLRLVGRSLKDRRVVVRVSDPQHHRRPPNTVVMCRRHSEVVLQQPSNSNCSKALSKS